MFRIAIRGTRSLHTTPTLRGGFAAIALAAAAALGPRGRLRAGRTS